MKIGDTKSSRPVAAPRTVSSGYGPTGATTAAPTRAISDSASVMGIPAAEMTPRVRDAIMSLMSEVERLRQDVGAAKSRITELEKLADKDPLIPVFNRRAFVRELSRAMSIADRYDTQTSLIYIDLNNFKDINDQHGHAAGDAVLQQVGRILTANVRESDAVGRLGGDEFGVILAFAGADVAEMKAQSLAKTISTTTVDWKTGPLHVGASVGAFTLEKGQSVQSALEAADKAMYEQKKSAKK